MPYNQQGEISCNCEIAFELVSAAKNNGIKQVRSRNCVAIAMVTFGYPKNIFIRANVSGNKYPYSAVLLFLSSPFPFSSVP